MKVFGKPQPEKAAQPARHIAVAGQGIVQPEGGRDNQNPHRQHRTRGVFHLLNRLLDRQVPLCQNHQLGKTADVQPHPLLEGVHADFPLLPLLF